MRSPLPAILASVLLGACFTPAASTPDDADAPDACTRPEGAGLCVRDESGRLTSMCGEWDESDSCGNRYHFYCGYDCRDGYGCNDHHLRCEPFPGADAGL